MTIRQPRNGGSLMRLSNDIHVIPINDFRDHEETEHCWCRPQRDDEEPRVVIHNALDGREDYENGRKQH